MKGWKVQKLFGDVVYDLRNKGLLPVVILLVVAMVAVPVLISRGGSSSPGTLQPIVGAALSSTPETENAVVSYNPGIRDYRKRLDELSPKNPFRQEFAGSAAKASQLNSTVDTPSSGGGGGGSTDTTVPTALGGTGTGSAGGKKKNKKKHKVVVDYQVNLLAGEVESTLKPFADVAALTPLPSPDAPALLYYGLTNDHKRVQFLVSNRVGTLTGPGRCVPAPDDCALLTLGPGQSEDVLYTADGKTYRVVVAEIKRFTK